MNVLGSIQNTNTENPPTVDYFKAIKKKKSTPKTPYHQRRIIWKKS